MPGPRVCVVFRQRVVAFICRAGHARPLQRLPLREGLRPQATDEGRVHGSFPLTGTRRKAAPHPASVGASATFPPKGEGFYPKNAGSFSASFSIARPLWLMASFSAGVSWA